MKVEPRIMKSCSILDSEDLIDTAYNGLLACLGFWQTNTNKSIDVDVISGSKNKKTEMDLFHWATVGVYVPSNRNYWFGSFDIDVDEIPNTCCVWTDIMPTASFEYTVVQKIKHFPRGVVCSLKDKDTVYRFRTTYTAIPDKEKNDFPAPLVYVSYFAMNKVGDIHTSIDARKFRYNYKPIAIMQWDKHDGSHLGPGALSLTADQKYLWIVETQEETAVEGIPAKMKFGIEEPMVKSLFFAREMPLTETGRKKPILHWVSEHKRRIKENIEIDISKYLRGTTEMVMESMQFKITSPEKNRN